MGMAHMVWTWHLLKVIMVEQTPFCLIETNSIRPQYFDLQQ